MAGKVLQRPTTAQNAEPSGPRGSRLKARRKPGSVHIATWSRATPAVIATLIETVTAAGDLISFGRTSDLGALHLYIKAGDDEDSIFFKPSEDVDAGLQEVIEAYQE